MAGPSDFDAFYKALYGDRWKSLRAALLAPNDALGLRFNARELFSPPAPAHSMWPMYTKELDIGARVTMEKCVALLSGLPSGEEYVRKAFRRRKTIYNNLTANNKKSNFEKAT